MDRLRLVFALASLSSAACASSASAPVSNDDGVEYVGSVVSFTPGAHAGYGADKLPGVVEGPPVGGGCCQGSTDVLSLGAGGEIVVAFDAPIVDGPGVDLLVFENAFEIGGDPTHVYAELGEVSVSDDGVNWTVFPCASAAYPFTGCAGWNPVYANPNDPLDPAHLDRAGGDPFDLATTGVSRAKYVRIRDLETLPAAGTSAGFDLDALAAVHFAP